MGPALLYHRAFHIFSSFSKRFLSRKEPSTDIEVDPCESTFGGRQSSHANQEKKKSGWILSRKLKYIKMNENDVTNRNRGTLGPGSYDNALLPERLSAILEVETAGAGQPRRREEKRGADEVGDETNITGSNTANTSNYWKFARCSRERDLFSRATNAKKLIY